MSTSSPGIEPWKDGGATPMIENGNPLTRTTRPRIDESP